MVKRLKILLSAFACKPNKGSEPAVGWHIACGLSTYHEVWVITRLINRPQIEAYLAEKPNPYLHFCYFDLPIFIQAVQRLPAGLQIYYYLWQLWIYQYAKKLHAEVNFNMAQHVTYVNYYKPSLLSLLGIPFIWGPVGGAETTSIKFLHKLGFFGAIYELERSASILVGELDPLVRLTAKNSNLALAATPRTALRLKKMGCKRVEIFSQVGLSKDEIYLLGSYLKQKRKGIRFISIGRMLPLKGFRFGLEAFLKANIPDSEYWFVGDGPDLSHFKRYVGKWELHNKVKFWGLVDRNKALDLIASCDILVHPSLHDSGSWVIAEAIAAGKPVICLDVGGPAVLVSGETGYKILPTNPKEVINEIAEIMQDLHDAKEQRQLITNNQKRTYLHGLDWDNKISELTKYLESI